MARRSPARRWLGRVSLARPAQGGAVFVMSLAICDQGLTSACNFLTTLLLARYLGRHEFGVFAMAWTFLLLASAIQNAVVISPMLSLAPRLRRSCPDVYYGATLVHALGYALLSSGVVLAACSVLPGMARIAAPLGLAVFAFTLQDYVRRYFYSVQKLGWALASDAISYVGQIGFLWATHYRNKLDVSSALLIVAFTSLAACLTAIPRRTWRPAWRNEHMGAITKEHWRFSRWLLAGAVLQWFVGNGFTAAAGIALGAAAAGVIRAALNVVGLLNIIYVSIENVLPAQGARAFQNGGAEALIACFRKILFLCAPVSLGLLVAVFLLAPRLVAWLYSAQLPAHEVGLAVRWLCLQYAFVFLNRIIESFARALECTHVFLWSTTAGAIASAAYYPAMARFGLSGGMFCLCAITLMQTFFLVAVLLSKRALWTEKRESACAF